MQFEAKDDSCDCDKDLSSLIYRDARRTHSGRRAGVV